MGESYSQLGQDRFVLSLFDKDYKGIFVDVGCNKPDFINNTLLLEKNGWIGISLDIADYRNEWKIRKTPFLMQDALICDYKQLFIDYDIINPVDYLSLDIEIEGSRYLALKKVMESGFEFKVITIEHDGFRGYDLTERQPQRKLLNNMGYFLLCSDIMITNNPMEDWWINPKYFNESQYMHYKCSNMRYSEILNMKK